MKKQARYICCTAVVALLHSSFSPLFAQRPAARNAPPPSAPAAAAAQPPSNAGGVSITLKDGKVINASALRRSGDNVMAIVQLGTGRGEIGYPVGSIAKIDFPEPPQLKAAAQLLTQNRAADALKEIDPIVSAQAQFREVAGSWWSRAATLKLNALNALNRSREAEALISELVNTTGGDPEAARLARVQMAALTARKGDTEKAMKVFDEVIAQSASPETLAQAWLAKGDAQLAEKNYENALMAFLHVPVFYSEQQAIQPAAMLGAARAFAGIDDLQNARDALNDIITQFPASPEAAAARTELQKLDNNPPEKKPRSA